VEAMGSYRRGEDTCGDLDILITRDPGSGKGYKGKSISLLPDVLLHGSDFRWSGVLRELIIRLVEKNIVTHTVSSPSTKTYRKTSLIHFVSASSRHPRTTKLTRRSGWALDVCRGKITRRKTMNRNQNSDALVRVNIIET
jgi:hypothetical protein